MRADYNTRELLQELADLPGVAGYEDQVARRIRALLDPYCREVHTDALGNCLGYRPGEAAGSGPRVLVAAHMDELGLMVTKIEEGGFLRVSRLGGVNPHNLPGQEVVVHGRRDLPGCFGVKPPHLTAPAERKEMTPIEDLFIDVGIEEAACRELVRPGDVVSFRQTFTPLQGTRAAGKALDNRASVAALLICLQHLTRFRHQADVFALTSVQEEVGLRGARVGTYRVQPHIGIAVDVNHGDMPNASEDDVFALGKGPVIARGPNLHPRVFTGLQEAARANHLPHRIEVEPRATGTDAAAIQITRAGVPTGLVSIPLRYMHSTVETVDLQDVEDASLLLATYIAGLGSGDGEGWIREL